MLLLRKKNHLKSYNINFYPDIYSEKAFALKRAIYTCGRLKRIYVVSVDIIAGERMLYIDVRSRADCFTICFII